MTHCFGCEGTGLICDICGKPPNRCECTDAAVAEHGLHPDRERYIECEDCTSSGE